LKKKLNIVLHQVFITLIILGLLFQERSNIHTHIMTLIVCASCWYWFDGCFMAKWQRDNVLYTPEDFPIIQKPKRQRFLEFVGMIVPLFLFDLYKLC
jgi:hypothetical protein